MPSFSVLTLPGDNGTWSVTLYVSSGDRPLKAMRDPERWDAVLAACPLHAHWAEGEPISGVLAMGGIVDRYRRMVIGGRPVATGVVMVGDAWACTNPSLGRGMALGLLHVRRLRDFVRYRLEHRIEMAEVWDTVTEVELTRGTARRSRRTVPAAARSRPTGTACVSPSRATRRSRCARSCRSPPRRTRTSSARCSRSAAA
jgi:2-polyprenyl-6-methoxyphenol hydroxylase-like FAD-dependent oxidoreductase